MSFLKKIFKKNEDAATSSNKPLSKEQKDGLNDYYTAVKIMEKDVIEEARNQRNLFKILFIGSVVLIALQAIAITTILPLQKVKTVVVRVDNNTGFVDLAPDVKDAKASYKDNINKYFLGQFVTNYETYDWETIQHLANSVKLTSNSDTYNKYDNNLRSDVSPLTMFKDAKKVVAKIGSVTFIGEKLSTVRFTKFILTKQGKVDPTFPVTKWIATIKFDYSKSITKEQERLINPLGFNVLSYRVDRES